MVVLLVRHAVAVSRLAWAGDDTLRPLDERGRRQAGALVQQLSDFLVGRVLSSPTARCVATVEPLASARGLSVTSEEDLFEGHGAEALALVRSLLTTGDDADGRAVVLCSHGDVLPEIVDALEREGAELGKRRRCQKGSVWVFRRDRDGHTAGAYMAPPA